MKRLLRALELAGRGGPRAGGEREQLLSDQRALVGVRQAGKAESAMNALQSMMKATARVRRDGVEAEISAEQLVVGDVVLIAGKGHETGQTRAGQTQPFDDRVELALALEALEARR